MDKTQDHRVHSSATLAKRLFSPVVDNAQGGQLYCIASKKENTTMSTPLPVVWLRILECCSESDGTCIDKSYEFRKFLQIEVGHA